MVYLIDDILTPEQSLLSIGATSVGMGVISKCALFSILGISPLYPAFLIIIGAFAIVMYFIKGTEKTYSPHRDKGSEKVIRNILVFER